MHRSSANLQSGWFLPKNQLMLRVLHRFPDKIDFWIAKNGFNYIIIHKFGNISLIFDKNQPVLVFWRPDWKVTRNICPKNQKRLLIRLLYVPRVQTSFRFLSMFFVRRPCVNPPWHLAEIMREYYYTLGKTGNSMEHKKDHLHFYSVLGLVIIGFPGASALSRWTGARGFPPLWSWPSASSWQERCCRSSSGSIWKA